MRATSPLRYPGGKTGLTDFTAQLLKLNRLERGHYVEPFAGGCGLALSLLYGGFVAEIHVNDLDPSIWSFWHSVLNDTADLIEKIVETPVNIDEWHRQREIYRMQKISDPLELGFSAFFLNRTNRSGIIKGGGVIGGLDQSGSYKLDCRYNIDDLCRRIKRVARYKSRIHLTQLDAVHFLSDCAGLPQRSLLFIDPPYFKKGPGLYSSYYKPQDHEILSRAVLSCGKPWIVTYDDVPEIRALYRGHRQLSFDIRYSLHSKRLGTEIFIASKGMKLPAGGGETQRVRVPSQPPASHIGDTA